MKVVHRLLSFLVSLAVAWARTGHECVGNCTPQQDIESLLQALPRTRTDARFDHRSNHYKKFKHKKRPGNCQTHAEPLFNKYDPPRTHSTLLDPDTIDKFVTPLLIPPVMKKNHKSHYKSRTSRHIPPVTKKNRKSHYKSRTSRHNDHYGNDNHLDSDYDIAMLQFKQQILPGGIYNNANFRSINKGKKLHFPATQVWSYGRADDPEPDSSALGGGKGIAPAPNSQVNYPAYTVENVKGKETTVNWINHLVEDPWTCNFKKPHTTYQACKFIQHITTIDQSLHWANPNRLPCKENKASLLQAGTGSANNGSAFGKPPYSAGRQDQDCLPANNPELREPYRGPVPMVVHVHGGNTAANSDGYPESWWMPAASNIPNGYAKLGKLVNRMGRTTNKVEGAANFKYPNDQPTTTLWYHDHTLGITRNNVYAGPAGFWLIRKKDGSEDGLEYGQLPWPAPRQGETFEQTNLYPGRNKYREIPLVIQDRSFKNGGKDLFYPESRAFFEGLPRRKLRIPLRGDRVPSDVPPFWNPEAFFNVMVVNGGSWPVLEVEPDIYRFRILNGCNSRTLNLAMFTMSEYTEIPFYQIGGDQSLLPQVVKITTGYKTALPGDGTFPANDTPVNEQEALLLGPAERADVLIDFRNIPCGTVIRMFNSGPDAPFAGFPIDEPASNESSTGQIMEFRVIHNTLNGDGATSPEHLKLRLPQEKNPANQPPAYGEKVRDLALLEDDSSLICRFDKLNENNVTKKITWDPHAEPLEQPNGSIVCKYKHDYATNKDEVAESTPFGPTSAILGINGATGGDPTLWSDPIDTNPDLGATETWEFWDLTVDAHPIHIHEVKFRVINRQQFSPENFSLIGEPEDVGPTNAGWKDTVVAYPGYVTRVRANFDRPGLYVWHCHILEHEDNEMMVPYCIGNGPGCQAVQIRHTYHHA